MGSYLVRIKVMPSGPEVPSQKLLDSVKGHISSDWTIRKSTEEPIAFGLYALVLDVVAPEAEGVVDRVEESVSTAPDVAQYELIGVSRLSSQLKNV